MDPYMNLVEDHLSFPTTSKPSLGTTPIKSYSQNAEKVTFWSRHFSRVKTNIS